ncbi:caspase family protein [Candidatus Marinimicrobia bacterium PRS2]|nr:caspase family protein [Candidatus Marinimicrobia bacterium PRS2]
MYKLLPILLFAFLIAEENQEPHFIQSDSLDFIWAEDKIDYFIKEFYEKIENIIDKDKFQIKVDKEVYDVMRIDTLYSDIVSAKQSELHEQYPNEKLASMSIHSEEDLQHWRIAIFKINIQVNVDKTIEVDGFFKKTIMNIIKDGFIWGENSEVKLDFVDISTLKHNNIQLSLNRDDIYDESWAVIIGIDKYENLSNLDYAVADAEAVKDMLVNKFDYKEENIKLLLNEEANKANIVNVISDVSLKAGENDRILVFYAGHGETMPLPDGGEMGYLVPIDGRQENLYASAIPMDDLKRLSNMSKAKHMLFLVDACYGGLAAVGSRGLEPAKTPNYIEKISNIKSRQIITAGGKDEKVFEKSEWGHSAFTKNLLSALEDGLADSNEDGYITADELGDYLSEKVSIDSENQQTPQSRRLTSHEGEFIFMHSENTVVIQDKSADAKLDYLISEMEELKSQKSSGVDIVVEQTVDEKEEYGYLYHSINLMGYEDNYVLGYGTSLDKNWAFSIVFANFTNKLAPVSIPENHSFIGNILGIVIGYNYWFNKKMMATIVGGVDYTTLSWNDSFLMTSGDKTLITPVTSATIAVFPFEIHNPLEMRFGFSFGLSGTLLPNSYYMEEDKVIIENMDFEIFPLASFNIMFPKNN